MHTKLIADKKGIWDQVKGPFIYGHEIFQNKRSEKLFFSFIRHDVRGNQKKVLLGGYNPRTGKLKFDEVEYVTVRTKNKNSARTTAKNPDAPAPKAQWFGITCEQYMHLGFPWITIEKQSATLGTIPHEHQLEFEMMIRPLFESALQQSAHLRISDTVGWGQKKKQPEPDTPALSSE